MCYDIQHLIALDREGIYAAACQGIFIQAPVYLLTIKCWHLLCLLQLGRTPLHLACEKGHIAAAAALVAGGADLLAKDRVS